MTMSLMELVQSFENLNIDRNEAIKLFNEIAEREERKAEREERERKAEREERERNAEREERKAEREERIAEREERRRADDLKSST